MVGVVAEGRGRAGADPEWLLRQMWDLSTGKLIDTVKWDQSALGGEPCLLYAAKFSKDAGGSLIAAGGSGSNEAKVFDRSDGYSCVGSLTGLTRGVFTLDWHQNRLLACAGGDAAVRLFEVRESVDTSGGSRSAGAGAGAGAGASERKEEAL